MSSKVLGIAALAIGCVSAAAGGAYVAVRQNVAAAPPVAVSAPTADVIPAGRPVTETEAVVERDVPAPPAARPALEAEPVAVRARPASRSTARPASPAPARRRTDPPTAPPAAPAVVNPVPSTVASPAEAAAPGVVAEPAAPEPVRAPEPPQPEFEELVIPASAVIGLQVDTLLSSERARVEDRVEARVTRDVLAAGRVAIPAGSRVHGSVTAVERGGKVKEKARLGVRFHTLVLANGVEVPLRTEAIFRDGEPPSGDSARKIGGATIGGAILGAILGGGKGAAVGGAAGAAGGTAAVMAGDRNAATLPAGTILTVRLLAPLSIEVERQPETR
jgi:hypothetical protein